MKTILSGLLALTVLLSGAAAAIELHERKWVEIRTEHFVVRSAISRRKAIKLARNLEYLRAAATLVTNVSSTESPIPTNVYVLRNQDDMELFGADHTIAGFISPNVRDYNIVVRDTRGMSEIGIVLHEYVHFLIRNHNGIQYPSWFDEGFAEYLGGSRLQGDFFKVGLPQKGRLSDTYYLGMLPMSEVLRADQLARDWSEKEGQKFYAQVWLLLHYLIAQQDDKLNLADAMTVYLQSVESGETEVDAFEAAFGLEVATLNQALADYANEGRYGFLRLPAEQLVPDLAVSERELSEQEAAFALAELAMRMEEFDRAADWYSVATSEPALAGRALIGQAMVAHRRSDTAAADSLLNEGLALCAEDPYCRLDQGRIAMVNAFDAASTEDRRAWVARAREAFVAAWQLNDQAPEAYYRYGQTFLVEDVDTTKAIEMLEEARWLLSSNLDIRMELGRAYAMAGRLEDAQAMLRPVVTWSHSASPQAEAAQRMLDQLEREALAADPDRIHEPAVLPDD